jgi:hypothetical protein
MPYEGLKVNGERLNATLQSTCTTWGALSNSAGMRRLALSQEDKEVRDWLVTECKALGCEVKVDQMGNIFAVRPGTSKSHKPIGMGSHLDTQPAGKLFTIFFLSSSKYTQVVDTMASWASNLLSKFCAFWTKIVFKPNAQ